MPEDASRVTGVGQSPRSVRHASVTETVLHSFRGASGDGAHPAAGLTYFKGTLYGTTGGTVFSITPSGTYTVLHSLDGYGYDPLARLIVLKGTLYGTAFDGGHGRFRHAGACSALGYDVEGHGTVFSITPSGQATLVHTFLPAREGWWPQAPLLNVNGTLYGTTCGGGGVHTDGDGGDGTVFTMTPSGDEHVIYRFNVLGGAQPGRGRLIDLNGTLYGTASGGGKYSGGVVFSLSTGGKEKLLHSFVFQGHGTDGYNPVGGLTAIKHTLYGTTQSGGTYGDGTVFSITPTGKETVLHDFTGSDGSGPEATLLNVNGTLYGTTSSGGAYGDGTVFSITLSGQETVLYSFMYGQDGADPQSGLNYVNGTFYGTTYMGGAYHYGTVYSLTL
jgi:uncharacterized repeat protein (TIGR03803 family)